MISRSLGPEFGGAIGFLFYFANIVSSSLNVVACVEGAVRSFGASSGTFIPDGGWGLPEGQWWSILYSSGFNTVNLFLCLVGAELFGKFSLGIFSIVSSYLLFFYLCNRFHFPDCCLYNCNCILILPKQQFQNSL